MKEKVNSVNFMIEKPTEKISNNLLSFEKSDIKTEDILSLNIDIRFFPQPSTDDREDFEINIGAGDDLVVYKSPALLTVNIARKDFKNSLNNIVDGLTANIVDFETDRGKHKETIKKIRQLKKLINKNDTEKKNIQKIKLTQTAESKN